MKTGHGLPKEMTSPLKQEEDARTGDTLTPENRELMDTDQISDKRVRQLAKSKFGEYDSNYKRLHKEQQTADSTFIMKNQTTVLKPKKKSTGSDGASYTHSKETRMPSTFRRGKDGNVEVGNTVSIRTGGRGTN